MRFVTHERHTSTPIDRPFFFLCSYYSLFSFFAFSIDTHWKAFTENRHSDDIFFNGDRICVADGIQYVDFIENFP